MDVQKKICPMSLWGGGTKFKDDEQKERYCCIEHQCAWWVGGKCAEIDKAESLREIADAVRLQADYLLQ